MYVFYKSQTNGDLHTGNAMCHKVERYCGKHEIILLDIICRILFAWTDGINWVCF